MKNPFKKPTPSTIQVKVSTSAEEEKHENLPQHDHQEDMLATQADVTSKEDTLHPTTAAAVTPQGHPTHPPSLPLKKPRRHLIYLAIALTIWPFMLAAASCLIDPAAWPFFKAAYLDHSQSERLADYTRAYDLNHDPGILSEIVMTSSRVNTIEKVESNLRLLIKSGSRAPETYSHLAEILLEKPGHRDEAVELLKKSVANSLARPTFSVFDSYSTNYDLYSDNRLLLQLGDVATVDEFCRTIPANKMPRDEYFKQLKGLTEREKNNVSESKRLLQEATVDYFPGNALGARPYYYLALLELDAGKVEPARKYLQKGASFKRWQQNEWLRDLTGAWIEFQQGNDSAALQKADAFERAGVYESDAQSAVHLLRQHIFRKQGDVAKALVELKQYQEGLKRGRTGKLYIPKIYRHWIDEVPPAASGARKTGV